MEAVLLIFYLIVGMIAVMLFTTWGQKIVVQLPLPTPLMNLVENLIAAQDKRKADNKKKLDQLNQKIDQLRETPQDPQAIKAILNLLKTSSIIRATTRAEILQILLVNNPENSEFHQLLKQSAKRITYRQAYNIALHALEENPEVTKLKGLALALGRTYYGNQRKDRKVTIYDEQAINNDISSRAK